MFTVKKCKPMTGLKEKKYGSYPLQLKKKIAEEVISGLKT
jgi:hypothetical protein